MPWWGTLLGGTLGFMFGGPLGALLGAALGRNFDRGIKITDQQGAFGAGQQERVQAAFFTTTFSVMGHIAKADGKVTKDEIAAANTIMGRMQLNEQQRKAAIKLFNEGKKAGFPLHDVLQQFRRECSRRHNLMQMFLEIQIATAMADGHFHASEKQVIFTIGEQLGFNRADIEHLFSFSGTGRTADDQRQTLTQAYEILGVTKSASDAEVKKAYRRMMSQHHPDKLIAKGLPEEMIKLATEKTQQIKAAYEQIKDSRD
ncbi:MAG: co-chaperone DjlA [Gammaproteobacteria bacterium]|nr:MAG: co-chaperone DjlA [Gammaproteobacteria bacterium]HDY81452.1 co-chaperone DjlA [Halieaceae bacterium]